MANTVFTTSGRKGTTTGCAPGSRRISVTLSESTFNALRDAADAAQHGLSGEAAEAIERDLRRAVALQAGRAS